VKRGPLVEEASDIQLTDFEQHDFLADIAKYNPPDHVDTIHILPQISGASPFTYEHVLNITRISLNGTK
jgi:hypothetical protein